MLLGWAAPASAQGVPNTAYNGYSPSSLTISIPVIATVGGRCGFAAGDPPDGSYDAGSIDINGWSHQFDFTLECTGPSRIAVVSANGGLKTTPAPGVAGYVNVAPYDVLVSVVRTGGTTTGNCAAADLLTTASTVCALRGTAAPTVGLAIVSPSYQLSGSYLQVSAPAYAVPNTMLVSGSYADTLTVTVSPAS